MAAIRAACRARKLPLITGRTWTTDAFYRETPTAIRRRRREGCLVVEMEAAALFAIARFRGAILGQILYAGDDVSGPEWQHRRWHHLTSIREAIFALALDACVRIP